MQKSQIGKIGENCAEKLLIAAGHLPVRRNFHSRFGEIDLITFDYPNSELVFTEVKTRTGNTFGTAQDAITKYKKHKIIKTALCFLGISKQNFKASWRIDFIAVQLDEQFAFKDITHFKNIFDG